MNHLVEKMLFVVFLAGVLAAVLLITVPVRTPQRSAPSSTTVPPPAGERSTGAATPEWAVPWESSSAQAEAEGEDPTGAPGHDHGHGIEPDAGLTTTTFRYPPVESGGRVERGFVPGVASPSDAAATPPAGDGFGVAEAGHCPPIEDLWIADSHPVEDPCTLAEVPPGHTPGIHGNGRAAPFGHQERTLAR